MAANRKKAWRVRQAITRAIANQPRTIHTPVHVVEAIHKVFRVFRLLRQELGHDPSPEEIAAQTHLPLEKVREILKTARENSHGEEDGSCSEED